MMKSRMSYLHRTGFPPMLVVVEFDLVDDGERIFKVANFHIGFGRVLSTEQVASLQEWWLNRMEMKNNQGGSFQYDAKGGGHKLASYLAKDVTFKGRTGPRPVKWPPEWVPKRIGSRLWFTRGLKNAASKEGLEIRRRKGCIRRKFPADRGLE